MNCIVSNRFNNELIIQAVNGVAFRDKFIQMRFNTEEESFKAFQQIRRFGVACHHAGRNAPMGPMVVLPKRIESEFNFEIR